MTGQIGLFCYALLPEDILVLIDDFTHQHLAPYIGMEAVDGKAGIHNGMALIVEVRFQVNEVGLVAYPAVDLLEFYRPLFIRSCAEGELDIGGTYGHQRQENGADVVGLAFYFDGVEVVDDDIWVNAAGPQAVGAGENQQIQDSLQLATYLARYYCPSLVPSLEREMVAD